jgi:hypothetical protein
MFGPNPEWTLRYGVVVGSRGLGKSYVAATSAVMAIAELETLPSSVPNKNISLICGSNQQVADVYLPLFNFVYGLDHPRRCVKHTTALGQVRWTFKNGTTLSLRSAEVAERMRGTGQYMVILDEMPTWELKGSNHETVWESIINPTITTRWSPEQATAVGAPSPGRALFIASPLGKDYFYELSMNTIVDPRWKTRQYTYRDSPLLSQKTIEEEKKSMDPMRFAREYEASFEESGARVYHSFDRVMHVEKDLAPFGETETVHAAIDFNVLKNCTSFHAIRGGQIHTLEESIGTANTQELAELIRRRFPKNKIICYPDPSGVARKTSAVVGVTDFSILRQAGFEVLAKSKAPGITDSANAVNRMFLNAAGETNWYVAPVCTHFIKSLERTVWLESRPDSAIIDKSLDVEHFGDGARYFAEYMFPVNSYRTATKRGFVF